jgi:hypothetical protein
MPVLALSTRRGQRDYLRQVYFSVSGALASPGVVTTMVDQDDVAAD